MSIPYLFNKHSCFSYCWFEPAPMGTHKLLCLYSWLEECSYRASVISANSAKSLWVLHILQFCKIRCWCHFWCFLPLLPGLAVGFFGGDPPPLPKFCLVFHFLGPGFALNESIHVPPWSYHRNHMLSAQPSGQPILISFGAFSNFNKNEIHLTYSWCLTSPTLWATLP